MHMTGGIITNNRSVTLYALGGAINGFQRSDIRIDDGIIANNSSGYGGGIAISNQMMSFDNSPGRESSSVGSLSPESLRKIRAQLTLNGGVIANNRANKGGGLYIDSDDVHFNKTMLLDNTAEQFGGGAYISFPPHKQRLEKMLITENKANQGIYTAPIDEANTGGGLWNCPTGYVHIGDGHTVYVFNNKAKNKGDDLRFSKKTGYFKLTVGGKDYYLENKFYSHVSPITQGYKNRNTVDLIKFLNDQQNSDPIPGRMSYTTDWVQLKAIYSAVLQAEAWATAQTFIMGNQASNGGGIGSNASLETPEDEGEYDLLLKKKWSADIPKDQQKTIIADIFIVPSEATAEEVRQNYGEKTNYYKYGEVELNAENHWTRKFSESKFGQFDDLPAAFNDKGLPFTAPELKAKGFKYLVVERDSYGFVSTIEETESVPIPAPAEEIGVATISRVKSQALPDYDSINDPTIYLYLLGKDGKMKHLSKVELNQGNNYQAVMKHPLLAQVKKQAYYGEKRTFLEYGEEWSKVVNGLHIGDQGYAFFLTPHASGQGYILQIPYLWIQDYDQKLGNAGFKVVIRTEVVNPSASEPKKADIHSFTIYNRKNIEIPVVKKWHADIKESDRPKSVRIYLLHKGQKIQDGKNADGQPIYRSIILSADNQWRGVFDRLDSQSLSKGYYSIQEEASDLFRPRVKENFKQDYSFRIHYKDSYSPEGENYDYTTSDHFKEFVGNVDLNLYLDGKLISKKTYVWKSQTDEYGRMAWLEKEAQFDHIKLSNLGQAIRIASYDRLGNTPGLASYDFYLKQDQDGIYTLYVPRLFVDGVPYDLFEIKSSKGNQVNHSILYDNLTTIPGEGKINLTVTNYPLANVTARKVWQGGSKVKKPSVTIRLMQNGVWIGIKVLDRQTNQVTWTGLDKYDEHGVPYIYTVEEDFTSELFRRQANPLKEGNVFTLTNEYIIPKTHLAVEKVWQGGPVVKPTITIALLRDGQVIDQIELQNGQTNYQWKNLDKTDKEGRIYIYTVSELPVEGYSSVIGELMGDKVTIVNSYNPPPEIPEKPSEPPVPPTPEPKLPKTGQNSWISIYLFAVILIVIGNGAIIFADKAE